MERRCGDRLPAAHAGDPIGLQPKVLSREGFAANREWSKDWARHGRKVHQPASILVGLNIAGARNSEAAQCGEVDVLRIDAMNSPARFDDDLHGRVHHRGRRRMLRRGRSTSGPPSTDCTWLISVATCCRSPWLLVATINDLLIGKLPLCGAAM